MNIREIIIQLKEDLSSLDYTPLISSDIEADISDGTWVNIVVEGCEFSQGDYLNAFSQNTYKIKIELCYESQIEHIESIEKTEQIIAMVPSESLKPVKWTSKTGQLKGKRTEFFMIELEASIGFIYERR